MKEKIKELIRYGIVGVLTTLVSLITYYSLVYTIINPKNPLMLQVANIISWVVSVIFAYVTNRKYVFKSENTNKIKEASSFIFSRILTLALDMAIMFVGVSVLAYSDKFVKIFSQIVIIVLNYIIGKFLVFRKRKEKKIKKERKEYPIIVYIMFIFLFVTDMMISIFNYQDPYYIFLIIKSLLFIFLLVNVFLKKRVLFGLMLLILIVIQSMYVYVLDNTVLNVVGVLLNIYLLPLSLVYLSEKKVNNNYETFFLLLFSLYGVVFSIFYFNRVGDIKFYYDKYIIIGRMLMMMPFIGKIIFEHHNYITKTWLCILIIISTVSFASFGYAFLVFMIFMFYSFKNYKNSNNKIIIGIFLLLMVGISIYLFKDIKLSTLFDKRINNIQNGLMVFDGVNLEEQIFGLFELNVLNMNHSLVFIVDMLIQFGYFGFISYLLVLVFALYYVNRKQDVYYVMYYILLSFIYGFNVINYGNTLILGLLIVLLSKVYKKRILIVSNMYPSKKYPHYGTFVRNTRDRLDNLGFETGIVVLKKHDNKIFKIFAYLRFYSMAMLRSIISSYDYYYVHFTSHSGLPVILGTITGDSKLICNVHGNDIVLDCERDIKNISRSKLVLKYARKVVCPSSYFEDILCNEYKINSDKIIVFPSGGVNKDVFHDMDRDECLDKLSLDKNYHYYGMVSRIEKDKGYDIFLGALQVLFQKNKLKNIKVLYIGTGDEQDKFYKLVQEYKLEDVIIQIKFVNQSTLALYYNVMDLFIFPTRRKSESLGLVGLEAMATSTFVIGCDLYGPRSYLVNNVNSLTFKDQKGLVEDILKYQSMSKEEKENVIKEGNKTSLMYNKDKIDNYLKEIFD